MRTTLKKFINFILITGVLLIGLHIILLQWRFNAFLPQVKNYLTDNYMLNVKSVGNIHVKLFPFPQVVITNIEISEKNNMVFVPETQIKINFSKLFTISKILDLQSISIHNPQIKVYNDIPLDLIKEIIFKQIQHNLSSKISIINGTFQIVDSDTEVATREIQNLYLLYNHSYDKNLKVSISFNESGNSHSLFLNAKDLDKELTPTNLTVSLKYNLLHLHAQLYRNKISYNLSGKANIHFHDKVDDKFTDIEKFFGQQDFKKIEADIELNKEFVKVYNFTTTSTNIKNLKGSASYYINNNTLNFDIDIDNLNLDAILLKFYGTKKVENLTTADLLGFITTRKNLTFTPFITTSTNLHINKLFYKQDNIDNFNLNFSLWSSHKPNKSKILINDLSMVLPGSSKFHIDGVILDDQTPIFKGQTSFISNRPKDLLFWYDKNFPLTNFENTPFIIKSGIILMPYVLQLHDIQSASKDINMLVDILTLNYPDTSDLQIYTEIIANKINLDHLSLNHKLSDLIYTLYSSDFDNSGEEFTKNTDNFNFIRSQKEFKNFIVEAKELIINKEVFNGFNVNIDMDKYYLKLDHLHADNRLVSYTGEVQLDLSSMKPKLNVNLTFSKLNSAIFNIIFPSQLKLEERYRQQLSLQQNKDNDIKISDINFYGINNFNGKFKFAIDKFYAKDIDLSNVKLLGSIVNGGIKIDDASAQGFNGDIKITGNISTLRPMFSLECGIGLDNINPSLLFNYLINSNNNTGYMSTSGILSTKGMNRADFIKNLSGQFHIQGKNIKHNDFGLLELAELPQLEIPYNEKLKRLDYYKKYGTTQFDDVKGDLIISNGIAKALNIKLNNKRVAGLLNLAYSFVDDSLGGNAKFSFIPRKGEQSRLINVHSSGDISNAQVKVDTKDLEEYLNKQSILKTAVTQKSQNG